MKTYNDVYIQTRKKLKAEGIEAFGLEARLIASAAAGKTKEEFLRDMNLYTNSDYEQKVSDMIDARLTGEPIAYVTGEWEFYGLPMVVNRDVLIPRIDTEVLAEKAIDKLQTMKGRRVLDLCSGSGCIGITLAVNVPDSKVILVDNSLKAMRVARQNVLRNNVTRSVTCVDADATQTPPMLLGRFDMIVSNPPYIPTEDIFGLDPSVRDNEPKEALDGGKDGLDFYRSITEKWKSLLKKDGCLMFEVGIGQAEDVRRIMEENGFEDIRVYKDTLEIERVVSGTIRAVDEDYTTDISF